MFSTSDVVSIGTPPTLGNRFVIPVDRYDTHTVGAVDDYQVGHDILNDVNDVCTHDEQTRYAIQPFSCT